MRASRLLMTAASAALLLASAPAGAQPGGPPPPPPPPGYGGYYAGPPQVRQGLTLGVGLGIGGMDSDSNLAQCFNCDYEPASVGLDFHIGGMINPRMAVLFELWGHGQAIDRTGANALVQTMWMGAVQYWLTPQLWLKGGLGLAVLDVQYDDGYYYGEDNIGSGLAVMGAGGYELLHAPNFAIDLQLRLGSGNYDGISEQVNVLMVGLGANWY